MPTVLPALQGWDGLNKEQQLDLLVKCGAVCKAALEYDAAIQRYAIHGKSWVGGDDLDALYEAWINKATQLASALKALGIAPS